MEELLARFPYAYEMAAASFVGNVCNTVWSDGKSTRHWIKRVVVGFCLGIILGGYIASKLGGGLWDFMVWTFIVALFTEIFMELIPKLLEFVPSWIRAKFGKVDIITETEK